MDTKLNTEFISEFFRITSENDDYDFYWNWDWKDGLKLYVNCNDVFAWATADCEEITAENLPLLEQAYNDCNNIKNTYSHNAKALFCARVRKQRPQGAMYEYLKPELAALFDACGPDPVKSDDPFGYTTRRPYKEHHNWREESEKVKAFETWIQEKLGHGADEELWPSGVHWTDAFKTMYEQGGSKWQQRRGLFHRLVENLNSLRRYFGKVGMIIKNFFAR